MRPIYIIALLLLTHIPTNIFGQTTYKIKKPKYERVSQAYGYLMGQEYTLSLIKSKFPNLELNITKAQITFNSTFSSSKEAMKTYLIETLSDSGFNSYVEKVMTEIKKLLGGQTFTEETATNFISEVESRAKGNIASPVLETLLSFQYFTQPHRELLDGFTRTFKTKGHIKSKDTDWQIEVPVSWRPAEGDRPNIIQRFTSDFGDGSRIIMLGIKELPLPKEYKFSKQELNDFFTEKEAKGMVPEGGKFISFTKMTLDNNIGGMLQMELKISRLDLEMKIRMVQFMFVRSNKMYILQGTVGSEKTDSDLASEMKKYLPLYKLVANSIVVNDQYK
jgi:hypothetical protein